MKKRISLWIVVITILLSNALLSKQDTKTLAILDFSNNSLIEQEKYASLSQALAEIMTTELSKVPGLQLVERRKMTSLLKEMELSQSGIIFEQAGLQVGRLLGAHYLVFGSYMVSFDHNIRIDLRIVEVETGLTIKAEEVTDKVSKLFDIIKKLNDKIVRDLDIRLTKEARAAWMSYDVPFDIISTFSMALKLEEQHKTEEAKKIYQKILSKNPNFEPARKRLEELMVE